MALRRIKLSLHRGHALELTRVSVGKAKLVYVLITDKKIKYSNGKKSRIAYIGTTEKGNARIAQSVAARAEDIFDIRGVHSFHARIITCRPRRNVKTWRQLERALLIKFKEMFGEVPYCNIQGKNISRFKEFNYFAEAGVQATIEELS
ncbi:hypothetical protein ASD72_06910 [Pseudoxanthomonas sp. Root630]|nr:hypothetical protein ASD72_06910 [Pseudoxanthomonas sp. Root630]